MKGLFAAALFVGAFAIIPSPTLAESCTWAHGRCLQPRSGACDAACRSYCKGEYRACMATGSFRTRNHSWTGLTKS